MFLTFSNAPFIGRVRKKIAKNQALGCSVAQIVSVCHCNETSPETHTSSDAFMIQKSTHKAWRVLQIGRAHV